MPKSLKQLIKDYGNACYANNDDDLVVALEREILTHLKPLTDEEVVHLAIKMRSTFNANPFARAIEAAHGITHD